MAPPAVGLRMLPQDVTTDVGGSPTVRRLARRMLLRTSHDVALESGASAPAEEQVPLLGPQPR